MSLKELFEGAEQSFKAATFVMARWKNVAGVSHPKWVLCQSYVAHSGDLEGYHAGGFAWTGDLDRAVRFKEGQDVNSDKGPMSAWLTLERGAYSFFGGAEKYAPASLAEIDEMKGA